MTYQEGTEIIPFLNFIAFHPFLFIACGRRPWFDVKNRFLIYPDGVRNGASEARIGANKTQENEVGRSSRGYERRGRIVNGETADYAEWPWQISLRQWRTCEI